MTAALPLVALAAAAVLWGTWPAVTRLLVLSMAPADVMAVRFLVIVPAALLGLYLTGMPRVARADFLRLLSIGVFGMAGYTICNTYGLNFIEVGAAALIVATQPLLIAAGSAIYNRERLPRLTIAGIALAFAGTMLMLQDDLLSLDASRISLPGALLIFASSVAWAYYVVLAKPLIAKYGSSPVTYITLIACSLPLLFNPFHSVVQAAAGMNWWQWAGTIYIAIPCSLLAMLAWNYGAGRVPSAAAGTFLYSVPVVAIASGVLFLGESVTPTVAASAVLIFTGVALAQWRPRRLAQVGADPST